MRYDAVIFDMDGTVLDTLGDLTATLNHALSEFGYPPRTAEETRSFIGNGVRMLLRRGAGEELGDEKMGLMYKAFVEYYKDHLTDKTRPYDGIADLLKSLREAGLRVALLSNKADFAVAAAPFFSTEANMIFEKIRFMPDAGEDALRRRFRRRPRDGARGGSRLRPRRVGVSEFGSRTDARTGSDGPNAGRRFENRFK